MWVPVVFGARPAYLVTVFCGRVLRYKDEAQLYKEEHLRDRQRPHCYVQYMVAIINNCQTFKYVAFRLRTRTGVWRHLAASLSLGCSLAENPSSV